MKFLRFLGYFFLFLYATFVAKILGTFIFDFSDLFPSLIEKLFSCGAILFLVATFVFLGQILTFPFESSLFPKSEKISSIWKILLWAALGLGFFSLIIFIWGWAFPGALKPKLIILTGFLIPIFFYGLLAHKRKIISGFNWPLPRFKLFDFSLILFSTAAILLVFLACFSPITYYDSLVYHLGLPQFYLSQGKIGVVPFNLYSLFPASLEMIFLYILGVFPSPESIINLLCLAISLGVGLGIWQWVKETQGRETAIIAFFLWWTMPAVLLLSFGAYIDIALAFYIFISLRSLEFSREKNWHPGWLILSGIFSGIAASIKYTGLLCPLLFGIFLLWKMLISKKLSWGKFLLFFTATLSPFLPWLIRNAISVGNPVFPFAYQFFKSQVGWTQETAGAYFQLLTEYGAKSDIVRELFQTPWKIATTPMQFGKGFDVLGDFGWPLILLTVPLAPFVRIKLKKVWLIFSFFTTFAILWFFMKPVLRFLIAILPIGVFLSAIAIQYLLSHKIIVIKWLSSLFILPWLVANFFFICQVMDVLQPFSVSLGLETREKFLERKFPFYATYDYANKNLFPFQGIFVVGEQRGYHLKIPYICANLFSKNPLADICNNAQTSEDLEKFFKMSSITHILISQNELARLGGLKTFGLSENGQQIFSAFFRDKTSLLYSKNSVDLFSLR